MQHETVVPNPKLKLLDQMREVMHLQVGQIDSVRASRPARVPTVLTAEEARQGGSATKSPLDCL